MNKLPKITNNSRMAYAKLRSNLQSKTLLGRLRETPRWLGRSRTGCRVSFALAHHALKVGVTGGIGTKLVVDPVPFLFPFHERHPSRFLLVRRWRIVLGIEGFDDFGENGLRHGSRSPEFFGTVLIPQGQLLEIPFRVRETGAEAFDLSVALFVRWQRGLGRAAREHLVQFRDARLGPRRGLLQRGLKVTMRA